MKKLEHIGIAVKNLDKANLLFAKLLGSEPYKIEDVPTEGVRTSFFEVGGVKIELLEPTKADSPIAKFIEKRGEGLHHVAFEVEDIKAEMKQSEDDGFLVLQREPRQGADNKLVSFLHPKTTHHVLVEWVQEKKA